MKDIQSGVVFTLLLLPGSSCHLYYTHHDPSQSNWHWGRGVGGIIGKSRNDRIQTVELLWIKRGADALVFSPWMSHDTKGH